MSDFKGTPGLYTVESYNTRHQGDGVTRMQQHIIKSPDHSDDNRSPENFIALMDAMEKSDAAIAKALNVEGK